MSYRYRVILDLDIHKMPLTYSVGKYLNGSCQGQIIAAAEPFLSATEQLELIIESLDEQLTLW